MLVQARDFAEKERLHADICIIGGGAAGITLARELVAAGLTVILLEAGGETAEDLSFFAGEVTDSGHAPLTLYRNRRLGGTTRFWGGRCVPYDPIDFEKRPWIAYSGWPIAWEDLAPYYRRAAFVLDAGEARFTAARALPGLPPDMIPGFHDDILRSDSLERFSLPTDFAARYGDELHLAETLRVILGAAAVRIALDPYGVGVDHIVAAAGPGHHFAVEARHYVLAGGALETVRLLLASDDVQRGGIGNGRDLLGRFYMCHLEGKAGVLTFPPGTRGIRWGYETDRDGVYVRRRFTIAEDEQRRRELLNMVARFEPPLIADPAHRSGILSAMYLSRSFIKAEYARKLGSFGYRGRDGAGVDSPLFWPRHLRNLLADAPALVRFAIMWTRKRKLAERKLPFVAVPPDREGRLFLDFNAEQVPNPDSRVTLTGERDAHGVPRLKVDWRYLDQDIDSVIRAYRLMKERLEAHGLCRFDFAEEAIREGSNAIGGHHIGIARMAADPSQGVVDANGCVFGVNNLFIAGSATFPTSGHANPTLTIVALALRLADHLRRLTDREEAPLTAALRAASDSGSRDKPERLEPMP